MRSVPKRRIATALTTASDEFRDALLSGLRSIPKSIPCKYFYDAEGSRLFEQICDLPEYYPTRTELSLLRAHSAEIAALAGPNVEIMEFGAGAGEKIRIILDALESPRAYIPMDISDSSLGPAAERLASAYPGVAIHPVTGDFASELRWPFSSAARRIGFFPGSTIGNFTPPEAREFLSATARLLRGGALLIGVDLVKDPAILHAAYNDSAGVTAAFNRNLLARANRELDTNFDVMSFSHYAFYNPVEQRIEMHLVSDVRQFATVSGRSIHFAKGETLITEYSYKYNVEQFQELAASAGFVPRALWSDSDRLFSMHWLETAGN